MKTPPTPRQEFFDTYWQFAAKRQAIFDQRAAGLPGPWTDDPILQDYKFCNVYRAADRVSQYLIREVAYHDEACTDADRLFQIVAFRTFSKIETWQAVQKYLGHSPTIAELASGDFQTALEHTRAKQGGLYTGAFILCANKAYGHDQKHRNHIELFKHMFIRESLADRLLEASSLEAIYDLLRAFPLMGDFMSYQTTIDLNYSALINFGENDFTKAGPGALRGIDKCFSARGDYTPEQIIQYMVQHQDEHFQRLGLKFGGLYGRPLHAIDCQNLFCEVDKYSRVAYPELASNRQRIKSRFAPHAKPQSLFFPPKWGINHMLPESLV